MSSHTRKLTETIKLIEALKQSLKCNATYTEYTRGMYNGVEMVRSLLQNVKPEILERKKKN